MVAQSRIDQSPRAILVVGERAARRTRNSTRTPPFHFSQRRTLIGPISPVRVQCVPPHG